VGRFNVYNWLAAAAVAVGLELPLAAAAKAAATVAPVPGRMQTIDAGQPFTVVVDFAHTPNALENVLGALRAQTAGRLIVVFGHAGGRDRANRPGLARAAGRHSEFFVITSDDPYDEEPEAIIDEIERGAEALGLRRGREYERVADRRSAIALALAEAREGDVVVIAGRGHERSMTIGPRRLPFDDAEVARDLLLKRLRRTGEAA
jgi:UDP-N-acetylmuramoyl-L-alanyl-D-glutamate--2,6-diaminopimelate ligase